MARSISDEEIQLKRRARRRLIGAIVLVTAVVVALPMVLDTEPRPISSDVSIRIPAPDSGSFTSRVVPVAPSGEAPPGPPSRQSAESKAPPKGGADKPAPVPSPPGKVAKAVEQPAASKTESAPAKEAPAKEAPAKAAPAKDALTKSEPAKDALAKSAPAKDALAKSAPAKDALAKAEKPAAKDAPAAGDPFVVQVIALADAEKAKQVQAQIAAAGLKSYTEVVKTVKGEVTRVRAGPFPSRAAAEKAQEQLKAVGLAGNIVPK